jgi:hypothetical protein
MKNIHVILADKPGRIGRFVDTQEFILRSENDIPRGENVNILITNDEEIKEGDWIYDISSLDYNPLIHKATNIDATHLSTKDSLHARGLICTARNLKGKYKKIILTTDSQLIADGVQAIDDNFLEWFVKNPSCEEVEVKIKTKWKTTVYDQPDMEDVGYTYKIIIPQEECCESVSGFYLGTTCPKCNQPFRSVIEKSKQEALEKVLAQKLQELNNCDLHGLDEQSFQSGYSNGFVNGANWKQEKTYSEEEAGELVYNIIGQYAKHYDIMIDGAKLNELFEQLKKK